MHLNPQVVSVSRGSHSPNSGSACIMEMVSCLAGESWTDAPLCVSPTISRFLRSFNDGLADGERDVLKQLIPVVMGTRTGEADELRRSRVVVDWMVREYAPAFLDLAGLGARAQELRQSAEMTNDGEVAAIMPTLILARDEALAAWIAAESAARMVPWSAPWSAVCNAAWSAARNAAESVARSTPRPTPPWSGAWDAAWNAAESAAESAAWNAAESAARSAVDITAWDAARSEVRRAAESALRPAAESLQRSAIELVKRMAQVGRTPAREVKT